MRATRPRNLSVLRTSGYAQSYLGSEVKLEGGVYDTVCNLRPAAGSTCKPIPRLTGTFGRPQEGAFYERGGVGGLGSFLNND